METNMSMANESEMTRPMTTEEQAQMLDEEADFYVRYNGGNADEHRWVQSLRGGADRLRRSLVTAQEMSAVYAANRILLNRADRTEEAECTLAAAVRERDTLRETNTRLNRRLSIAEAAVDLKVEDFEKRSKRALRAHYFEQGREFGRGERDTIAAALAEFNRKRVI